MEKHTETYLGQSQWKVQPTVCVCATTKAFNECVFTGTVRCVEGKGKNPLKLTLYRPKFMLSSIGKINLRCPKNT